MRKRFLIVTAIGAALVGIYGARWIYGNRLGSQATQKIDRLRFMNETERRKVCESISKQAFVTGLFFNQPGTQTFFSRSMCFQRLAALEQNEVFCDEVIERPSFLLDGSRISEGRCLEVVIEARAKYPNGTPDWFYQ